MGNITGRAVKSADLPVELNLQDAPGHSHVALDVGNATSIKKRWGLRLVCVSDTHGNHRTMDVPEGDVLIHAGDFTLFGRREHALDFDAWLAELPHKTKIVILGNHENNADWNKQVAELLPHATVLRQSDFQLSEDGPRFFGTDFFWPIKKGTNNPYFEQIPEGTDVILAHGPALGCADGGQGCEALLAAVRRVRPALVVSGHIHRARGASELLHEGGQAGKTVLLNAANCGSGKEERRIVHSPIVVDI